MKLFKFSTTILSLLISTFSYGLSICTDNTDSTTCRSARPSPSEESNYKEFQINLNDPFLGVAALQIIEGLESESVKFVGGNALKTPTQLNSISLVGCKINTIKVSRTGDEKSPTIVKLNFKPCPGLTYSEYDISNLKDFPYIEKLK